jgi:hypothetical protein
VTGSCEYRDEPSGSGATELVNLLHGSVVSDGWVTVNGNLERYRRKQPLTLTQQSSGGTEENLDKLQSRYLAMWWRMESRTYRI